eukprot:5951629-Prymnesium_polylepis.1
MCGCGTHVNGGGGMSTRDCSRPARSPSYGVYSFSLGGARGAWARGRATQRACSTGTAGDDVNGCGHVCVRPACAVRCSTSAD